MPVLKPKVSTENTLSRALALPAGPKVMPKHKKTVQPATEKIRGAGRLGDGERAELSQTLHDTVCQSLTAAYFSAKFIERKCQGGKRVSKTEMVELCEMIHAVVTELQGFARQLRGEEEEPAGEQAGWDGAGPVC